MLIPSRAIVEKAYIVREKLFFEHLASIRYEGMAKYARRGRVGLGFVHGEESNARGAANPKNIQ
jgi:hypothetical protein